ncbi:4'-phosphopantetheinyl transferase family protein [Humidisolicoccus flavus]|uniref:4'-phosphopantetheinyl transferase family protein n=1 Tax=Humidisolicoccus flavus TaxID=3111414 RepID=UPI00325217D6
MIDVLDASVDEILAACDAITGQEHGRGVMVLVSRDDREAAHKKLNSKDRRRKLASRVALRLLAASRLGIPAENAASIVIDRRCERCGAQHGRPQIAGLSASSSSSGDRILVAVAPSGARIGIDIERIPERLFAGFDAFALHPRERGFSDRSASKTSVRLSRWVEKEAAVKSAGIGLDSPFDALRIVRIGDVGRYPHWAAEVDEVAETGWSFVAEAATPELLDIAVRGLPSHEGYRSAIAARTPHLVKMQTLPSAIRAEHVAVSAR